jgi:heme/copper-type cytochrome/quinol oxidase subunit 3
MRLLPWISALKSSQADQNYEQYSAYSQLLDRNGQWIGVADTKAGVILGFLVATFPVLATPALPAMQRAVKAIPHNANFWMYIPTASFIVLFALLLALFLVAALVTLLRVLMTLTPRVTRQEKPGLIFFNDIAGQEYKEWQQRMLSLDSQALTLQVLEQVYATACIADRKHKHVRQAIRALIATVLLGIILYIFSQFTG